MLKLVFVSPELDQAYVSMNKIKYYGNNSYGSNSSYIVVIIPSSIYVINKPTIYPSIDRSIDTITSVHSSIHPTYMNKTIHPTIRPSINQSIHLIRPSIIHPIHSFIHYFFNRRRLM